MIDILERLRGYNPPDRVLGEHKREATDFYDAATEISDLRARLEQAEARCSRRDEDLRRHDAYKIGFVDGLKHAIESIGDEVFYFSPTVENGDTTAPASPQDVPNPPAGG